MGNYISCRSGVEPPTGMIHPRESRGTEDRKRKPIKRSVGCLPDLELRVDI